MENEFPSNSNTPPKAASEKQEPKEVRKVISGEAIQRKKSVGKRIQEFFVGNDSKMTLKWVYTDVIVPGSKKIVFDMFTMGLQQRLWPGDTNRPVIPGAFQNAFGNASYTAYNRMNIPAKPGVTQQYSDPRLAAQFSQGNMSPQARQNHDFREIVIPSRAEAVAVLDQMYALLAQYEVVTLADFYNTCGITPAFTDERWGWYSLQGSDVSPTRDGWVIDLPSTSPLQ